MLVPATILTIGCALLEQQRRLSQIDNHWVYSRQPSTAANARDQGRTWPDACNSGMQQSPIDVQSSAALPAAEPDDQIDLHYRQHIPLLYNSGIYFELDKTEPTHSVRRTGEPSARVTGEHKGWLSLLGRSYNFYQVHWHAPSENRIDGVQYAMEAHFVHQLNDSRLVGTNQQLAVVAVLYELASQCNSELDAFWERMPMAAGDAPYDTPIDLASWLEPLLPGGHFRWQGSLTTPPCTEGVTWLLLRSTAHVCARQVERLQTSLRDMQAGVGVNNRVEQPLHGRVVHVTTAVGGGAEGGGERGSGRPVRHGDCPECGLWQWMLLAAAIIGLYVVRVRVIGCVTSTHRGRQLLPTSSTGSSPVHGPVLT